MCVCVFFLVRITQISVNQTANKMDVYKMIFHSAYSQTTTQKQQTTRRRENKEMMMKEKLG